MNSINKTWVNLIWIVAVVAMLITVSKVKQIDGVKEVSQLEKFLNTERQSAIENIKKGNFLDLNDNVFLIRIDSNRVPLFWNDPIESFRKNMPSVVLTDSIILKDLTVRIILCEDKTGLLLDKTSNTIRSSSGLAFSTHDGDRIGNYLKVAKKTIYVTVTNSGFNQTQSWLYLLAYLTLISMLMYYVNALMGKFKISTLRYKLILHSLSMLTIWVLIKAWLNPWYFDNNIFWQSSFETILGDVSLASSLTDLCVLAFTIVLTKNIIGIEKIRSLPYTFRLIVGSLTISIIFYWMIYLAQNFTKLDNLNFNTTNALEVNQSEILFILLLLGYCVISFYLSNVWMRGETASISLLRRLTVTCSPIIILSLIGFLLLPYFLLIPVMLFLFIYILSFDVYLDQEQNNLSSFIWWVILHAAFIAFVIYKSSDEKRNTKIVENLNDSFYHFQKSDENDIYKIITTVSDSKFIEGIANEDKQNTYDYNDIFYYIENLVESTKPINLILESVELYDSLGTSLFSNLNTSQRKTKSEIKISNPTDYNLYYNQISPHFIYRKTLGNNIEIYLKFNIKGIKEDLEQYIVYRNGEIISERGVALLPFSISKPILKDTVIQNIRFFTRKLSPSTAAVAFQKETGMITPISLFSITFGIMTFLLIGFTLINLRYNVLSEFLSIKLNEKSSLRVRLQVSVILLIVFSFIIIGIITVVYFRNSINEKEDRYFGKELHTFNTDIDLRISNFNNIEGAQYYLIKQLSVLRQVYDIDLKLYDERGIALEYMTILDSKIDQRLPLEVISNINFRNKKEPNLGVRRYNIDTQSAIIPLYLNAKQPFAYISYQNPSLLNSNSEVKNYMGTILNVYVFLFLLAVAISILIANSITMPLLKIGESLRKFKLGKKHDKLIWTSNDEIGELIRDYNNLTEEIGKSADIIAKTEREMAWREMAKQVAHEIQNPLTPMKLSIQYLEKAIEADPANSKKMITKISATIMEQINNLSQIANSFSNFASLPKTENEKIILNEVVEHIHDLFRKRDDIEINMIEPMNEIYVFADRNHLVRILNNVVKNAIQAIPEDQKGWIEIELTKDKEYARIRVSDNGVGIPENKKDKVFTPNFTTKSSGTGLGLAISANMLDTMNGKIYFESDEGKGTDFFIELPLVRAELLGNNEVLLEDIDL
jgi:nitrogen fixation/metabolism regulation signal transduction histidine kinase